jgi:hypothetical protein
LQLQLFSLSVTIGEKWVLDLDIMWQEIGFSGKNRVK